MRRAFALATLAALVATSAPAQDTDLESLDTWGTSRGWEAVGLLEIGLVGRCTGTLIAGDLVLTAAHCLYDRNSSDRVDPRTIEFRAGWRDGKSVAVRRVIAAVVDTEYDYVGGHPMERISNDLALLRLSDPIPITHADPFLVDKPVTSSENVSVVSYGQGRYNAPSAQRSCRVEAADGPVKAFTCEAVPGSSGSPIFALRDRRPRIVAVVSAIGPLNGKQVSFGMDVSAKLGKLSANMRSGVGVFPPQANDARRITVGKNDLTNSRDTAGGAKFVRP